MNLGWDGSYKKNKKTSLRPRRRETRVFTAAKRSRRCFRHRDAPPLRFHLGGWKSPRPVTLQIRGSGRNSSFGSISVWGRGVQTTESKEARVTLKLSNLIQRTSTNQSTNYGQFRFREGRGSKQTHLRVFKSVVWTKGWFRVWVQISNKGYKV